MAVTLISTPDELPCESLPRVVVLVSEDAVAAASEVVERLQCEPACDPAEAVERLSAREHQAEGADGPSEQSDQSAAYESALQRAREDEAAAWAAVPLASRGVDAERLHAAAAAVETAEGAVDQALALLGEKPDLSADAAQTAMAAEDAVLRAHQLKAMGIDRASTLLLAANAVGLIIIAGRIRTPVIEPLFVFVAALPLLALAYLVATAVSRTRAERAATTQRSEALRITGMATMTGLIARNARVKAWSARADALGAAEASLAQARRRWASLGGGTAPGQVAHLVEALAEARRRGAELADLEATPPTLVPTAPRHLVVVVDGSADDAIDRPARVLLDRLDQMDGTAGPETTVIVSGSAEIRAWAGGRVEGHVGAQVVDIRERVMASLERLRSRTASLADTTPPGPMAADG